MLRGVSERCLAEGVEGLRADLTLCKAAAAWAAYQGRTEVEPGDIDAVAEFALVHRRTKPPPPPSPPRDRGSSGGENPSASEGQRSALAGARAPTHNREVSVFESAGLFAARPQPAAATLKRAVAEGRWRIQAAQRAGSPGGATRGYRAGDALAWAATLRAATPHQLDRGIGEQLIVLRPADLRGRSRCRPAGCLLLFIVDASGSMAAWRRMRQTKAAILALLVQAYQRRDEVALLAFRGTSAELVLPPAHGLTAARRALEELPVGGATPLAEGLAAACRFLRSQQRRRPRQPVWTVLLTDGRANVARTRDPWADALWQARALADWATECLVVDTETGWPRFGKAAELACVLEAECLSLEVVLGRPLPDPWRRAI
jgi:magnesium chelatase subunit D